LWLLALADSSATWSLACRRRAGAWTSRRRVPAWVRRAFVLQLTLIYASAGLQKLSATWIPGGDLSALYYILQMPAWQRFDMSWLADPGPYALSRVATAGTWLFEVSWPVVPLSLWWRSRSATGSGTRRWGRGIDLRVVYVPLGLLLHVAIAILLVVGPFIWILPAYYVALYRPGELPFPRVALRPPSFQRGGDHSSRGGTMIP
jgi:hypothetical protein